ncbi:MAG: cysteine desulfurase-like protein [Carbonactinosporaceae bacterium]
MSGPDLDVALIRTRFPGLARTAADGRPFAFLDGPGGSQTPGAVIQAVAAHLGSSMANLGGAFATARETDATVDAARMAAADFTGATPQEIAFGANMTTLNFQLVHAFARTLSPGDEIVVTALDHDANVSPWLLAAQDRDLQVRTAPLRPDDGTLDVDALESLLGERTRAVAFTLASNALGTVTDARRIAAAAHRVGALAWADGVHYAPHRRIDRDALGLDVLLCSPYKFFGPHLGLAVIRRDLAESLPADRVRPAGEHPPGHRFETGTQSHEAMAGFVAAVDYVAGLAASGDGAGSGRRARLDLAYRSIERYETGLAGRFLAGLDDLDGITRYGIADPARLGERTPTFCLTVDGIAPRAVSESLAAAGIFTWDGDYYAPNVMEGLGLAAGGGAVRIGFLHYNTADEVDRCLEALGAITAAARATA